MCRRSGVTCRGGSCGSKPCSRGCADPVRDGQRGPGSWATARRTTREAGQAAHHRWNSGGRAGDDAAGQCEGHDRVRHRRLQGRGMAGRADRRGHVRGRAGADPSPRCAWVPGLDTLLTWCPQGLRTGGVGPGQSSPSTVARASSTAHISSGVRRPTRRPSRRTSTAPSCSTSTRVPPPATSTTGRNDAGLALREVGATSTTERGSSASDWTTTPYRSPCCSCPSPFGTRKR